MLIYSLVKALEEVDIVKPAGEGGVVTQEVIDRMIEERRAKENEED